MISVVVPMFNSYKTIPKCLQSIISQTFSDIEIIVIDDGSTDNGVEVVKKLSLIDARIKYIRQNNGGAGSARNHGIDISQGDYLCFIDSDDSVLPDYIENLFRSMILSNADISVCGYQEVFNDRTVVHILPEIETGKLTGHIQEDLYLLRQFINSPCMKLYKLQTIKKYKIRFDVDMVTAEDQYFNFQYYKQCKSISYINSPGYIYNRNDSTLSRMRTRRCYENDLKNLLQKRDYIYSRGIVNGEIILAETICYMARRYTILSDDTNDYKRVKERLAATNILRKSMKLTEGRDNILYGLINRKLFFLIYVYMWVRLHK